MGILVLGVVGAIWWWVKRSEPAPPAPAAVTPTNAVSSNAVTQAAPVGATNTAISNVAPPAAPVIAASTASQSAPVRVSGKPVALQNPGFEDGFNGWLAQRDPHMCTVVAEAAHTGTRGLRVADNSTTAGSNLPSRRFEAHAEKTYELRFWARIVSPGTIGVYLRFFDKKNKTLNSQILNNEIIKGIPPEARQWTEYTLRGVAPRGAVAGEIWIHSYNAGTVVANLDDFSLVELE